MTRVGEIADSLTWSELDATQRSAVLELFTQGWTLVNELVVAGLDRRGLVERRNGTTRLTGRGRDLARWALCFERSRRG